MCTGLEIAGLLGAGLSAAGTMVQQREAQKNAQRQAEARNNELKRTLAKNDQLAQDSRDKFNERQQQVGDDEVANQQQEATDKRTDALETAVAETPQVEGTVAISGSAPSVVKSELAKRMGAAVGESKKQAQTLGKLGGYGDTWLNQGFMDQEAGRGIATDANFAAGNMAILPYQQDIAEMRATKPISPLGGLLQGFGSMASSYGGQAGVPKKSYKSSWM